MKRLIFLVAALAAWSAPAQAQEWNWKGRVVRDQWIEVRGVHGAIRAVPSSGTEVEVAAVKSARRSNPDEVKLRVIEHNGGVTICAVYPAPFDREPNECRPGGAGRMNTQNNDVRVDFTVRVPAGVRFAGHTVNGSVSATRLTGEVKARTVNGSIDLSTSGLASASTVNGSINAVLGRADWNDLLEFETVNGRIEVVLPQNLDTEVHASTVNGSIVSDYPLTMRGRFGPKRASGTIGTGGRELELTTVNGTIEIRKAR